jgi:glutaredoxin 3
MKRLLRSYVYNGFVWELNCSTSGELNDDKSSLRTTLVGGLSLIKVINQSSKDPVRFLALKDLKQAITSWFAGEYDLQAINQIIDNDVKKEPIVMYSFAKCPYCIKAKALLLDDYKAKAKVVELDVDKKQGSAVRAELGKRTGRTSVPSIWIRGQFIGGCNDGPKQIQSSSGRTINTKGGVVSLDKENQLRQLLEEAGALER